MRDKIPSGAEHILRTLTGAGHEAWLVGDCVRDLLRGSLPHTWDICTSARPEETEACFAGETIIETGLKELAVNGRDVIAAGIASGPAVGQALAGLLERVLNGEVPNFTASAGPGSIGRRAFTR